MKSLRTLLWESMYGKARYNVDFVGIQCVFDYYTDTSIDEIEKYGVGIQSAKAFKRRRWFLTESGVLICGHIPGMGTLQVSIDVVKNIPFLLLYRYEEKIRDGYAVRAEIEGLFLPKGEVTVPRGGYWVNFFGTPE